MSVNQLTIHGPFDWVGPTQNSVFRCQHSKLAGVYLWTIPFKEQYLTYYVGQTGVSFIARLTQHTASYLDGTYRIWKKDDFVNGKRILAWHGRWMKGTENTIDEFPNSHQELDPVGFMRAMKLFLVPINANQRIRERIEAAIAQQISSYSKFAADFLDEVNKFYPRREDEEKRIVTIQNYDKIIGLSEELEI